MAINRLIVLLTAWPDPIRSIRMAPGWHRDAVHHLRGWSGNTQRKMMEHVWFLVPNRIGYIRLQAGKFINLNNSWYFDSLPTPWLCHGGETPEQYENLADTANNAYVVCRTISCLKLKQVTSVTSVHFLTRRRRLVLFPPRPPETTTPVLGSPCLEPRADHVQVIWIRHLWLLCLQLSGSQCLDPPISTKKSFQKTLLNNQRKKKQEHGPAMLG